MRSQLDPDTLPIARPVQNYQSKPKSLDILYYSIYSYRPPKESSQNQDQQAYVSPLPSPPPLYVQVLTCLLQRELGLALVRGLCKRVGETRANGIQGID